MFGPVAQLVRAPPCHGGGHEFESRLGRLQVLLVNFIMKDIFAGLRPAIIGLIAAAAVLLMNKENFGSPTEDPFAFCASVALFLGAFYFTKAKKANPILLLFICGIIGLFIF